MSKNKYPYIGESGMTELTILFTSENVGIELNLGGAVYSDGWKEACFKNITREYLTNTKVKIESQEHLDFLYELANAAGFSTMYGSEFTLNHPFLCFENDGVIEASDKYMNIKNLKLINLPLPPKEPEHEEWPQVGDEVLTANNYPLTVKGIDGIYAWCLDSEGDYLTFDIGQLKNHQHQKRS